MARRTWPGLASSLVVVFVAAFALGPEAPAIAQHSAKTDGAQPTVQRPSVALEDAFKYIQPLSLPGTAVLAAQGTSEGHWRFVNKSGEMFTAGTLGEMKRVVTVLYPDAKAGTRLALYMTEDTLLGRGVRFHLLPSGAERYIVVGDKGYRLLPQQDAPAFAQLRQNVGVAVAGNPQLRETLTRLDEPLGKAGVRLLVLQPGGPGTLPQDAPSDAARAVQGERVDPAGIATALAGLAGKTVVVCARGEGDRLYARSTGGTGRSLSPSELLAAADGADVALIVLQFSGPLPSTAGAAACPGGGRPPADLTLADILDAAAVQSRQMPVAVALAGRLAVLDAAVVGDLANGTGIRLGRARQAQLGWNLFDALPVPLPLIGVGLLLLGWLGTPVARDWWAKVCSVGGPHAYPGRAGYWLARLASFLAFAFVFQPLTSVLTAPANLLPQVCDAMGGVWRALQWMARLGGGGDKVKGNRSQQVA